MAKINTLNYQTVASWNGSQDLFIVEQPDGTKVATPNMVRQFMESFYDDVPIEGSERAVKSGGIFSTMAVPKYDSANRREYYEGGAAFDGNIDSVPTAGSNNAVASGGTKTYVDNAVKYTDVTITPSTSGHATPIRSGGGAYYESLVTYTALGVTKDKILNIILVDWNGTTKPFNFYLGSSTVGAMTDSNTSVYQAVSSTNLTLRVVYKN